MAKEMFVLLRQQINDIARNAELDVRLNASHKAVSERLATIPGVGGSPR
jgi:hypothetical protein